MTIYVHVFTNGAAIFSAETDKAAWIVSETLKVVDPDMRPPLIGFGAGVNVEVVEHPYPLGRWAEER